MAASSSHLILDKTSSLGTCFDGERECGCVDGGEGVWVCPWEDECGCVQEDYCFRWPLSYPLMDYSKSTGSGIKDMTSIQINP